MRGTHEPSGILLEDWFLEHVLLNPALAGAMRSLLGAPRRPARPRQQPQGRVSGRGPGLAPRRRPRLRPGAGVRRGLLFPPGHAAASWGPPRSPRAHHISRSDGDFTGEAVLAGGARRHPGHPPPEHPAPPRRLHRHGAAPHAQVQTTGAPRPPAATGSRTRSSTRAPPRTAATPHCQYVAPHVLVAPGARGTSTRIIGGPGLALPHPQPDRPVLRVRTAHRVSARLAREPGRVLALRRLLRV